MVKGIIFDFWGTLAENGIYPSPFRQVKYILRLNMNFKEFITKFEEVAMTKKYDDLNETFKAVCEEFGVEPKPFLIEKLVGMWNKNDLLSKPYSESLEILQYLKEKGIKTGLLTNNTNSVNGVMEKFGFKGLFDAEVYSYEEGLLKHNPEFFDRLTAKLELNNDEVIMIGDSIPSDILGANKAGIRAILVDRRNRRNITPKIINLRELKELIEKDELDDFASQELTGIEEQEQTGD